MNFKEIVASISDDSARLIMAWLAEAHGIISADDYDREYDDITPHLFEEIGDEIYESAYPDDRDDREPPEDEPLALLDGERAYYCRKCEKPRAFVYDDSGNLKCKVCGNERISISR